MFSPAILLHLSYGRILLFKTQGFVDNDISCYFLCIFPCNLLETNRRKPFGIYENYSLPLLYTFHCKLDANICFPGSCSSEDLSYNPYLETSS